MSAPSTLDKARSVVTSVVPQLGPSPRVVRPATAERVLGSGLRVLAARLPGVPLVELRLRVPFLGTNPAHPARASLLSRSMLTGTGQRDHLGIAKALRALGADIGVAADADRLLVSSTVLATGLTDTLSLLNEVLCGASYPADEVAGERGRLLERLKVARSQPGVLAREALATRLFGRHPYSRELPDPTSVAAVTPGWLRRVHADRVVPAGSTLVLVGDVSPADALNTVESTLGGWDTTGTRVAPPPIPPCRPGPLTLVERPGSVQSCIRLGGGAPRRDAPTYPAAQLANLVFGGYFSSRLMENIREDKGYTYGSHSRMDHAVAGSSLVVDADVATEVTAPAMLEIIYELSRIATLGVGKDELDSARQYAIGILALGTATQAGLASTLSSLVGVGLDADWLSEHPDRLGRVTVDDVAEAAHRLLAPSNLVTVVLGDASVEPELARLGPVERR